MSSPPASSDKPGPLARLWHGIGHTLLAATESFRQHDTLDSALAQLNAELGLTQDAGGEGATAASLPHRREPATVARPSAEYARSLIYAPDMDGAADPGEVVWVPVQIEGDDVPLRERAVVVVGREKENLLGVLISNRIEHANSPEWLFIGSGSWNATPRPSWVRVDRVLEVPEAGIRRAGASLPRQRFDILAARLREDYGWN